MRKAVPERTPVWSWTRSYVSLWYAGVIRFVCFFSPSPWIIKQSLTQHTEVSHQPQHTHQCITRCVDLGF